VEEEAKNASVDTNVTAFDAEMAAFG